MCRYTKIVLFVLSWTHRLAIFTMVHESEAESGGQRGAKPGLLSGSERGPNRIGINMVNIVNIGIAQQNWVLFQNPFQSQTFSDLLHSNRPTWSRRTSCEGWRQQPMGSCAAPKRSWNMQELHLQPWEKLQHINVKYDKSCVYYVYYICKYYTWIYNTSYV